MSLGLGAVGVRILLTGYNGRKEILAKEELYAVEAGPPSDEAELSRCYELYRQVQRRGRRLNAFPLPAKLFELLTRHPDFDVLRLYRRDFEGNPLVAFMLSHPRRQRYCALVVGVDDALRERGAYKQVLFQTVERANELGAKKLNLAFTAELEKRKLGAQGRDTRAYLCSDDDFSAQVMMNLG
jgi:hypothetical protein